MRHTRWLLPAVLVIVWLGLGGVTGPFAGKLASVSTDDSSAFLPASAESTRVADLLEQFTDTSSVPAIVVAERTSGLSAADLSFLRDTVTPLAGTPGFGPAFSPALPSDDRQAAQVIVPISTAGDPGDTVEKLRDALSSPPDGLDVKVTGPAGQIADLGEAFKGIDGILLLVAALVVIAILIVVYRSPILPFVVVISAVFALGVASGIVYLLAKNNVLELNGQSQGILFILVFGAATDYALLLVSRFREDLSTTDDRFAAMRTAWRATLEPVIASASTVILGVLCLLLSDLNSNRSLGPVAAIGIVASFLASMTFLPAALALLGRTAFWPLRPPHPDADRPEKSSSTHRIWQAIAERVAARPRTIWVATLILLLVGAAFAPTFRSDGVAESDFFLGSVDSAAGAEIQARHFDAGSGTPTWIIADESRGQQILADVTGTPGVATARLAQRDGTPIVSDDRIAIEATLDDSADSLDAQATVERIRDRVHAIDGANALVGGTTATDLDTRIAARHDRNLIIPVVMVVVLAALILLLRSLVAPILLLATTVLSFATTLGVAALLFNGPFGFPGADPVVPLFAFVFLVALGIDYNIFLMTRVREEALTRGTRAGMVRGLTVTGGVITSAGVVLAATFAALAVLPLLFLAQIAFLVAFGVLIDTLIVRTLLVPALTLDIGKRVWWPSTLSRRTSQPNTPDDPAGTDHSLPESSR